MLEAQLHDHSTFATLTYSEDALPPGNSLEPKHLQSFIKRLRKRVGRGLRYYGVGEYGSRDGRPHYHVALFGYEGCAYGVSRKKASCCPSCDLIRATWGHGHTFLGTLEPDSASYIAGYVSKAWTPAQTLNGRYPQFARMSLKPAIGLGMMDELASTLMQHGLDKTMEDVPYVLQHGTKKYPLAPYLRRKLRARIGRPENAPQSVVEKAKERLRPLREAAFVASEPLSQKVVDESKGRRLQIEARERMKNKRA